MFNIKKNDIVTVMVGKNKGKTGKVLEVITKKARVLVEGVNVIKKHQRKSSLYAEGGIVEKESPIHISNVLPLCKKCNKPTRIKFKLLEKNRKIRICNTCNESLEIV